MPKEAPSKKNSVDDPDDWSPLRRKVEGLRLLEDLRLNGPRLRIPEDVVRRTLAGQYGCTPDEVTEDQIATEVSALLPIYPTIYIFRPQDSVPIPTGPASLPSEVERRKQLLTEYKATTRVDSNRKIYTARNSGVHKPEFYQWLKGTLPSDSAPATNFERFLVAKKPPQPR